MMDVRNDMTLEFVETGINLAIVDLPGAFTD